jgi:hypothetical protein
VPADEILLGQPRLRRKRVSDRQMSGLDVRKQLLDNLPVQHPIYPGHGLESD